MDPPLVTGMRMLLYIKLGIIKANGAIPFLAHKRFRHHAHTLLVHSKSLLNDGSLQLNQNRDHPDRRGVSRQAPDTSVRDFRDSRASLLLRAKNYADADAPKAVRHTSFSSPRCPGPTLATLARPSRPFSY